jgi:hypothetical protein
MQIKEGAAHNMCAAPLQQAGGRGFEPRHTDPESAVLPLDEPPVFTAAILPRLDRRVNFGACANILPILSCLVQGKH